jgi:enoyl-CoA hydratase/carnithine racemase
MPQLHRDGELFYLDLGDDENRMSPDWLTAVEDALTEVQGLPAPRALVTTARGKTWSQGLDLEWLTAHPGQAEDYLRRVHALLARVLTLPVPCIAAVQGHCYAAGAMFALAHDAIVMREDRGYLCLPEVDIHLPFTPGMNALITARLTPATAHEAMTTGRRYGGHDALAAGIVTAARPEAEVLPDAQQRARDLAGKDPVTLGAIKTQLYANAVAALTT